MPPRPSKRVKLRKPQVAILRVLGRCKRPLTRKQISKLSGVCQSKIGDYAGPRPFTQSSETLKRWPFPALDTLGYVIAEQHDGGGVDIFTYRITSSGLKRLQQEQVNAESS